MLKPHSFDDLRPLADRLAPLFYRETLAGPGMDELPELLRANPRLMVVMNHGPALGPAPALVAWVQSMAGAGGGQRVPFGITWRGFYRLPLIRNLARRLTQAGADMDVDTAVERLVSGPFTDCCIMPEGELCNAGNGVDVQPFLSNRFIEIAVRSGVPVLLFAHTGTERLARTIPAPDAATALVGRFSDPLRQAIGQTGALSLPWLLSGRIPQLGLACELYQPELTPEDLKLGSGPARVNEAGRQVRARMQRLVNQLALATDSV